MAPQIVILGGGFAGLTAAHKLLKLTTPKAKEAKIVLVSESAHLYWNLASVRAVIPDQIPDDDLFRPLSDGFTQYPASRFKLIVGKATSVNFTQGTVTVQTDSRTEPVPYDQLVLATGSSLPNSLPFKHVGSTDDTTTALHDMQNKIHQAKSIVIAGGGATGVETMGELAQFYRGQKKLTLVISGHRALADLIPSVGKAAEAELAKMGVEMVHNATVTGRQEETSGSTSLTLSNGNTLQADLYIPLFGMAANTSFLPSSILTERGDVKLDLTLRVQGMQNVWAVGDVGNLETKQATKVDPQVKHLVNNLQAVLEGNGNGVTEYAPSTKPLIAVTIGRSKGTGQMGGWKLFGWLVSYMKGRTLLTEKGAALVSGSS
ncbi:hypothetical protein FE257_009308 [Aspergillus nanangensis]|uniref:FAD/NAD(P)-binding domain-containing protein n=1 Tax=Aspergillus nanangensis TaxID=2582783 RepID=A0AAD4GS32_ASPNN|nr:hypothetical protein FE257_009308 [Aspergillus nanangensis]